MDEIEMNWYFYSWLEEQDEDYKKYKDFGIFVGAFSNPDMANRIRNESHAITVSEEEFDMASDYVRNQNLEQLGSKKSKRRKIKLKQENNG